MHEINHRGLKIRTYPDQGKILLNFITDQNQRNGTECFAYIVGKVGWHATNHNSLSWPNSKYKMLGENKTIKIQFNHGLEVCST